MPLWRWGMEIGAPLARSRSSSWWCRAPAESCTQIINISIGYFKKVDANWSFNMKLVCKVFVLISTIGFYYHYIKILSTAKDVLKIGLRGSIVPPKLPKFKKWCQNPIICVFWCKQHFPSENIHWNHLKSASSFIWPTLYELYMYCILSPMRCTTIMWVMCSTW
jgi:hypothetical protein